MKNINISQASSLIISIIGIANQENIYILYFSFHIRYQIFNKNNLASALQQKNDVFREISKELRQLLTNKYGIKVIGADFKAHVTIGYSKDSAKEISDQLIAKLTEKFHEISNERIQPDANK